MTRATRIQILLAIILSSPSLAIERANADSPTPESDREQNQFRPYLLAPGLVGESFFPSRNTKWWGAGLQVVLYGWSDNNERPGPGQGSVFAQFSALGASGVDGQLFLLRAGTTLSFERNAARHWLIPYYGLALGAMHAGGSRGFAEASFGAYLLHSQHVVVSVDGGYLFPFSQIEEFSGIRAQLNVTLIPW